MDGLIADSAGKLFSAWRDKCFAALPPGAGEGAAALPEGLWAETEAAGFPLALLDEDQGGFGLSPQEALSLPRIAARSAVSLPLGETMVANLLAVSAGLEPLDGVATFCADHDLTLTQKGAGWQLSGTARTVPWGRIADHVVVHVPDHKALLCLPRGTVTEAHNLAAEPVDTLRYDLTLEAGALLPAPDLAASMTELGAMLRAQGLAGVLETLLETCVSYANERKQFGRPIGKFQAIQQDLAVLATEVAAAGAAADMAADALADLLCGTAGRAQGWDLRIAAAKLRTSEAAGRSAAIAHQVIAAIGFSQEFPLHPLTRRLWAWRDEFGNDRFWARRIGAHACTLGPDGFWPFLTHPEISGAA